MATTRATKGDFMNGKGEPKLIFPGLAGFYASVSDLWYPLIRFAIGAILFIHGYIKLANVGVDRLAGIFGTSYGLPMPTFLAYSAMFLETVGAACIAIGLFTRFFAAAIAIELLIAMFAANWAKGFSVSAGGYEYVLFLGIVMFAIALRGGGPYSVDRVIGKEL
jgi:putative oxidoreductase